MAPTLPAASRTASLMLLAPDDSVVAQLTAVPLTELVMLVHVVPPSTEPHSSSALAPPEAAESAPLRVAVMVWLAVLVTKSLLDEPASAEIAMLPTVLVGALVSSVYACVAIVPTLPAASRTASLMLFAPPLNVVAQLTAVPLTLLVMLVQVVPPSTEPHSSSALTPPEAAARAPLNVAVTVCDRELVAKSESDEPRSAEIAMLPTVLVGALVSSV